MPILSNFYGIIIKMYFRESEHNPPHIHAIYGEYIGIINIQKNTTFNLKGDIYVL